MVGARGSDRERSAVRVRRAFVAMAVAVLVACAAPVPPTPTIAPLRSSPGATGAPTAAPRSVQQVAAVSQPGRRSVAPSSKSACPTAYPIKGNKGSELIYHTPKSRSYDRTDPEECFATEADATAAGYRAARD